MQRRPGREGNAIGWKLGEAEGTRSVRNWLPALEINKKPACLTQTGCGRELGN